MRGEVRERNEVKKEIGKVTVKTGNRCKRQWREEMRR